jgi:hypothetical protein
MERLLELFFRVGGVSPQGRDKQLFESIDSMAPRCLGWAEIQKLKTDFTSQEMTRRLYDGIQTGWVKPRIEAVVFDPEVPDPPNLGAFRLECARRGWPLVDVWHRPCSFPSGHYEVLRRMDGSQKRVELAAFSAVACPDLNFEPWLAHLAGRGMFA